MDILAKRLMKIAEEIEVEAAYGRFDDMNPMTKPCPSCHGTMNYDTNSKNYRCPRCHHFERVQPRYFQGGEKRASYMLFADDGDGNSEVPFDEFCDYVKSQKGKMKHYRKNVKVRAWQSDGNSGSVHNELENATYADVPKGDWIVSNIANNGEMQVVKNGKFQKRYDIGSFEPLPVEE